MQRVNHDRQVVSVAVSTTQASALSLRSELKQDALVNYKFDNLVHPDGKPIVIKVSIHEVLALDKIRQRGKDAGKRIMEMLEC